MSINPALLIAAPMLQDYLVDNATGLPLANGTITLYQDTSRTTFKNWYYQSGSPGSYTYITLPNPMTLSAVGTIVDGNGNDTIPFYYPFSETDNQTPQTYYIVVTNSNGQQQFTRQNFPFEPSVPSGVEFPTLDNYLANNVFYRNIGSINVSTPANTITLNGITNYYSTLAPSQHDGFSMPDIIFLKNITGATDNITFTKFVPGDASGQVLTNDITPEYYLNFNCSASMAGETLKCVQIPISLHIKTLESVSASIVIHAQNVSGNTNNSLTLAINQFLGTGVTSPAPITIQTLVINNAWTKYVIPFVFPSAANLILGTGGDDALYLQIGLPLSVTCNINFTKPQIYLSDEVPTNSFNTYDEIDTIINSPRTGDYRTSINRFYYFGWVPMDDGTIGNSTSNANSRANTDAWPLFNLIWTQFNGSVGLQALAPMYTSTGTPTAYGANAYADWSANNQISLTRSLGRALVGTAANLPVSQVFLTSHVSSNTILTVASSAQFYTGVPVQLVNTGGALPTGFFTGITYYAIRATSTTIQIAQTAELAIAGTPLTFSADGSGTNTIFVPDYMIGQFLGEPFGRTGSTGYPGVVTIGSASLNTQSAITYANVFMKL